MERITNLKRKRATHFAYKICIIACALRFVMHVYRRLLKFASRSPTANPEVGGLDLSFIAHCFGGEVTVWRIKTERNRRG